MSERTEGVVTLGAPGEPKSTPGGMRRVPLCAGPGEAIQMAVSARRGKLITIGGIPRAEQLADKDVENLFRVLGDVIDQLGAVERRLHLERGCRERLEEVLDDLCDAAGHGVQKARQALDEVRDEVAIADHAEHEGH